MNAKGWGLNAAISLVVSLVVVFAHAQFMGTRAQIHTVDIKRIFAEIQTDYAKKLSTPSITDTERKVQEQRILNFGNTLSLALAAYQTNCRCTLIIRQAVIGEAASDATETIMKAVGLGT
jgi:hypothetical protein